MTGAAAASAFFAAAVFAAVVLAAVANKRSKVRHGIFGDGLDQMKDFLLLVAAAFLVPFLGGISCLIEIKFNKITDLFRDLLKHSEIKRQ